MVVAAPKSGFFSPSGLAKAPPKDPNPPVVPNTGAAVISFFCSSVSGLAKPNRGAADFVPGLSSSFSAFFSSDFGSSTAGLGKLKESLGASTAGAAGFAGSSDVSFAVTEGLNENLDAVDAEDVPIEKPPVPLPKVNPLVEAGFSVTGLFGGDVEILVCVGGRLNWNFGGDGCDSFSVTPFSFGFSGDAGRISSFSGDGFRSDRILCMKDAVFEGVSFGSSAVSVDLEVGDLKSKVGASEVKENEGLSVVKLKEGFSGELGFWLSFVKSNVSFSGDAGFSNPKLKPLVAGFIKGL